MYYLISRMQCGSSHLQAGQELYKTKQNLYCRIQTKAVFLRHPLVS